MKKMMMTETREMNHDGTLIEKKKTQIQREWNREKEKNTTQNVVFK